MELITTVFHREPKVEVDAAKAVMKMKKRMWKTKKEVVGYD